MDRRQKIIFTAFAKKASATRREYDEEHNPDRHKDKIEELRRLATDAYIEKQKCWNKENLEGWEEAETYFFAIANKYLLYGLHIGDNIYGIQEARIDYFLEEWGEIDDILKKSESISDVLDVIDLNFTPSRYLQEEFSIGGYTDSLSEFARFKLALSNRKREEYDSKFGPRAIFEEAGKFFIEEVFRELSGSKGRPRKQLGQDLNKSRAYQFMRLVKSLNIELRASKLAETTISEVCELCFGNEELLSSYSDNKDIKWVLSELYQTKNITVRAFLNSVSRGKASFLPEDWEYI